MHHDSTNLTYRDTFARRMVIFLRWMIVLLALADAANKPQQPIWIETMLLFSIGVLIGIGRPLMQGKKTPSPFETLLLVSVILIRLSFDREAGLIAALSVLPWLLLTLFMAYQSTRLLIKEGIWDAGQLCIAAAGTFPVVGAAWLITHRAGYFPFGFDPLITLLTAAHFHHAGFTLPLIAGMNAKAAPGRWGRLSCWAILSGVPFVAAGITSTHFGISRWVEPVGVTLLVIGALGVAISQICRCFQPCRSFAARGCFALSGSSLLVAMILALTFGLRHILPSLALPMHQMWIVHGSLNAFGFGLCGLIAWRLSTHYESQNDSKSGSGS